MTFNPSDLNTTPLFKYMWTNPQEGLAHRGLDEVTADGATKLANFALDHELDGTKSADGAKKIDADERAAMKTILEHDHYGAFFELDARPVVYEKFGIDAGEVDVPIVHHPKDAGVVKIPEKVSIIPDDQLYGVAIGKLGDLMLKEYQHNKAFFEAPSVAPDVRAQRTLGLLKDYADAMWSRGEQPGTELAGHALLDAFEQLPYAKQLGGKDFNGVGWGAAQSLVLGLDPNRFDATFPDAFPTAETTYLSMSEKMAKPMAVVDEYRAALGLPKKAEALEKRSPLGFMLGEKAGHYKRGNLTESQPFSTSGLNWGKVLFAGDAEIAKLPPKAGFEFPIDCLDGFNNFVIADPKKGDRLVVQDADGKPVKVEKIIEKDDDGKAVAWSAKFTNGAGEEVEASTVLGRIKSASGHLKGDGKSGGKVNMWWWGFCDRNTAQRLYKSKHKIPDIDRGTVKVRAGEEIIEFPKSAAQNIIDADVPDLVPPPTYCGFRFDGLAQTVKLKSGEMIFGQCDGIKLTAQAGCDRLEGNNVSIYSTPERPLPSVFRIGDRTVDAATIKSITRADGSEEVTVLTSRSYNPKVKGVLHTPVDWSAATVDGEKQILMPTDGAPLVGEVVVKLPDGNTRAVPVHTIDRIEGETEDDVRISQYSAWVSEQGGLYASDGCKGVVVSNGVRWVDGIDIETRHDDERPNWAPSGELLGIEGPVERQPGDRMLWIRGHYKYSDTSSASSNYDGFVQVGRHGRILNEGFCHGALGFGWGANGKLDWNAESTFNPHMPAELRLALLVNGVSDIESRAEGLNLPTNWRDYLVSQE